MPDFLTQTIDAGDLGDLVLTWDAHALTWQHPDRSVGETRGWWEGTPKFLGADLGNLSLSPDQAVTLWTGMMTPGPTREETRRRATAALERRGRDLMEALPSPDEEAADERADAA